MNDAMLLPPPARRLLLVANVDDDDDDAKNRFLCFWLPLRCFDLSAAGHIPLFSSSPA